jgi:rubrerythrin
VVAGAHVTRRAALRSLGAGLGATSSLSLLLAACGGGDHGGHATGRTTSGGPSEGGGDADVLNVALAHEHTAIAAYTAGAPLLSGAALAAGRRFLAQERQHADRLVRAIEAAGGTPLPPSRSYDFGTPKQQRDVLRLLETIEQDAIAAYVDALPRLADPRLRATTASILANEAEHLTVVRQRLGTRAVPAAFVTGGP